MRNRIGYISSHRMLFPTLVISAALVLLSGCAKKGVTDTPAPAGTPSAPILGFGEKFTTPIGNFVTVFAFDPAVTGGATPPPSGARQVAAEVEICAGPSPTERTGADPKLFLVETADRIAYPAVASVKQPELKPALLKANECARGWATFHIPPTSPTYVLLLSTAQAKWRIS
jgi:hypothetical protein